MWDGAKPEKTSEQRLLVGTFLGHSLAKPNAMKATGFPLDGKGKKTGKKCDLQNVKLE